MDKELELEAEILALRLLEEARAYGLDDDVRLLVFILLKLLQG